MITVNNIIQIPIFCTPNTLFKKLNSAFIIHPKILATSPMINPLFCVNKIPAKVNLLRSMEPDHIHLLKRDCTLKFSIVQADRPWPLHIYLLLPGRTGNNWDNKGISCFLTVTNISDKEKGNRCPHHYLTNFRWYGRLPWQLQLSSCPRHECPPHWRQPNQLH